MVTEYLAQDLDKSNLSLDSMFGVMTTLNSIVAILSGVVGEGLVAATGTKVSPFMAAVVCLSFAFILMIKFWVGDSKFYVSQPSNGADSGRERIMEIVPGSKVFRLQIGQLSKYYKVGPPFPTPLGHLRIVHLQHIQTDVS